MFGSFWISRRASFWLDRKRLGNGLIIIVKIMLMTMMKIKMIITIEKGEAYHLVPKSILLVNIRVIWKVNTALDLVQSFELNNVG